MLAAAAFFLATLATVLTAERLIARLWRVWRFHRGRCREEANAFAFGYGVRSEEKK